MGYAGLLFSLWNLIRNEFKTEEQIHKIQQKKLRKLLNYAYNNSVYYRREFEKAGITGSNINSVPFSSFPLMDKEQLMANFNEVVTDKRIKQEELAHQGILFMMAGHGNICLQELREVHSGEWE